MKWKEFKEEWKEFKEEWKKLDKNRQCEIVVFICGILAAAALIVWGSELMCDYMDLIPSDHRYAIGGAYTASAGFFLFEYCGWKYDRGRFGRIEDRIEKLEDKHAQEEEKCENNRA